MNVLDVIKNRRSVRQYDSRPIPLELMQRMKDALRLAPSASNCQPWKFVMVEDPALKQKITIAARNQKFIAEAPVLVIGVGFPNSAFKRMGGDVNSMDIDLAIAFDHLTLAAAAEGLGTCWIGAFDEEAVKQLINAPPQCRVVALTPLGYPAKPDLIHPIEDNRRISEDEIFIQNRFS